MKRFLFFFITFCTIVHVHAQIVFNGSTTGSGTGVSTLTYAKTIAAGNNRLLVVGVTAQDKAISSVKWNTLSLTQFTIGTRNSMRVAMYYIALGSSASPTTANVVVTLAGGTDVFSGAADYSGVWQTPPLQSPAANQAKSTNPSVTFTSVTSHKAVSLMGCIAASPTGNGTGQTQYWSFSGSHSNRATEKNGAASVTMTHIISASEDWVMIGGTMLNYAVVLPIELISFEADGQNKEVYLKWSTASEHDNDYFTIERSANAVDFESIGTVKGAGNSVNILNYGFVDRDPLNGTSYYRLKQTDHNGHFKYSNLVAVNISQISILNFSPNPASDFSHIMVTSPSDQTIEMRITSSDGKTVSSKCIYLMKGLNTLQINVNDYAEGVYFVSLNSNNEVLTKKQFIIKD